jgi:hypothetical protein
MSSGRAKGAPEVGHEMAQEQPLWNSDIGKDSYGPHRAPYQSAVLEQYALCVEMADRISARRASANTFFLGLNTAVLTVVGVLWRDKPSGSSNLLIAPLGLLLTLCLAWFLLVRSYRQLNAAKYAVIGSLEERLPASPYRHEWSLLATGARRATYWPLSKVEQWIPGIFAAAYIAGFCAVRFG